MNQASVLIIAMVDGTIPNMAGNGSVITTGVGLLSTMDDGKWILTMDGYGYLAMNGRRPGCRGVNTATIMDGLP